MRTELHGNGLCFGNVGILIVGAAGIGKSLLVLELLERGFQFICDDLCVIERLPGQPQLQLSRPESLPPILHSPSTGFIDVDTLFGRQSTRDHCPLNLVLHLVNETAHDDHLTPWGKHTILGIEVQQATLIRQTVHAWPMIIELLVKKIIQHGNIEAAEAHWAALIQTKGST